MPEVEYVIVAGIAATHRGSIRQTDDLDVYPRRSRENLERYPRWDRGEGHTRPARSL
jgi:hypothetical protein